MFVYIICCNRGRRYVDCFTEPLPYERLREFLDVNPNGWVAVSRELGTRWEQLYYRRYRDGVRIDENQFEIDVIYTLRDGCLIINTPTLIPVPETVPAI